MVSAISGYGGMNESAVEEMCLLKSALHQPSGIHAGELLKIYHSIELHHFQTLGESSVLLCISETLWLGQTRVNLNPIPPQGAYIILNK